MQKEETEINCPTFRMQEFLMKALTSTINRAKGVVEKAKFADELQKEVSVLLNCSDYKKETLDCKNCRLISNLRKKTAGIIIKAKELSEA